MKELSDAVKGVITKVHKLHKEKPLWITELGFPVDHAKSQDKFPPVKKDIQEKLVKATFTMMKNNRNPLNIGHAFYYDIQDAPPLLWEYRSGLLTLDRDPRPAWSAYSKLAGGNKCPRLTC